MEGREIQLSLVSICIQDGGMHAAFVQNKSIYFENQARYGIIVKEVNI
jgi:hypothetical protein